MNEIIQRYTVIVCYPYATYMGRSRAEAWVKEHVMSEWHLLFKDGADWWHFADDNDAQRFANHLGLKT